MRPRKDQREVSMKVKVGDKEVEAQEVQFTVISEQWNEYAALDGGRVRAKLVVQRVFRPLDSLGKPRVTPEGDPEFIVRWNVEIVGQP